MRVREATVEETTAVLNVLDGAALETDYDRVRRRVEGGETLVAVAGAGDDERDVVVGVLVLGGDEVLAVAVRRRRRGQGIGSALIATAYERRERLVAEFDDRVRPFYEALDFECEPTHGPGRIRGVRDS